jgi:hypothetical protein
MLATEVPEVGGPPQCAAGIEMVGDDVLGSVAPSDVALAPGSSGAKSRWLPRLYLPCSSISASL